MCSTSILFNLKMRYAHAVMISLSFFMSRGLELCFIISVSPSWFSMILESGLFAFVESRFGGDENLFGLMIEVLECIAVLLDDNVVSNL